MNNKEPNYEKFLEGSKELPVVLKRLGIPSLRKGQSEAVATIMMLKDCYTVLPTSHGKSLIFTVPTLIFDWKTIIFTPLVALMQDHLRNLRKMGLKAGAISSGQTAKENEMTIQSYARGELNFLLVAPERLNNLAFIEVLKGLPPDMVAVDEAHVLSQWAIGFRSSYCKISDYIKKWDPKVVLTLTATSPKEVEEDIIRILGLDTQVHKVIYLPPRLNLKMFSDKYKGDFELFKLINKIEGSGIVYCTTVKKTEDLFDIASTHVKGGSLVYNGQLSQNSKFANQDAWTTGRVRVVFCTNAFGLGINKPDTRFVVYRDLPGSIEELTQGFGRAGRDGSDAQCHLLFDEDSIRTQEFFIDCGYPSKDELTRFYNVIKRNTDRDGLCHMRMVSIAELSDVRKFALQAISHNLQAFRVIDRIVSEKVLQIKIVDDPDHHRYRPYYDCLTDYGSPNEQGFIDMEIDFLSSQCGFTPQTVTKHLSHLNDTGALKVVFPSKYKPIKIIGDISNVDFEYLRNKKEEAYKKLSSVLEFYHTPDDKKHDFIQDYFKHVYQQPAH